MSLAYLMVGPMRDLLFLRQLLRRLQMSEKDKDYVFTLLDAFNARTKLQGLV